MQTTKRHRISVVLAEREVTQLMELKASGQIASVAEFVRHAVKMALQDRAEFIAMLDESLARSGGPLTEDEKAWAADILRC